MKHYGARQNLVHREQAVTSATAKVSLASGMSGKEYMMISNIGDGDCYIGGPAVTSTNGYIIHPRSGYDWGACTPNFTFYVVSVSTTTTLLGIYET